MTKSTQTSLSAVFLLDFFFPLSFEFRSPQSKDRSGSTISSETVMEPDLESMKPSPSVLEEEAVD